jgi:hypothetical protein
MPALSEAVYWCARDLQGSPFGNHHFILLITPYDVNLFEIPPIQENTPTGQVLFYTIGAFNGDASHPDRLTAIVNNESDKKAVLKYIYPEKDTHPMQPDLDFESHTIKPPTGSVLLFRNLVVYLTKVYQAKGRVEYSITNANCASWVNTLFKVAGVSAAERKAAGDFFGIDVGADSLIPEEFFRT